MNIKIRISSGLSVRNPYLFTGHRTWGREIFKSHYILFLKPEYLYITYEVIHMNATYEIRLDNESKIKVRVVGSRFSIVYLLFKDEWIDIARVDNYFHEGKAGTHIHRYCEERVEFREMTFGEALETLIMIGDGIKERIKDGMH